MNRQLSWCAGLILFLMFAQANAQTPTRVTQSFDADWRFFKAVTPDEETQAPGRDDSSWRHLDVPHDWSIEGPIDQNAPTGFRGGFFPAGVGWYRKHFSIPTGQSQKHIFIEFDGVMANSDVWINGFHLGKRPYGYVGFRYDMTGHLNFGSDNVLSVRADNTAQPASRFYTGAGIYRHVRLIMTNPVHFDTYGTYVTTPSIKDGEVMVRVQSRVVNDSDVPVKACVEAMISTPRVNVKLAPQAQQPYVDIPAHGAQSFDQYVIERSPQLWNPDQPTMYTATSHLVVAGQVVDEDATPFGIRQFFFDGATGFWLNGKNIKLYGVCLHSDGGAFGAAVPLAVWKERLTELKAHGANAIRTAHNPPSPEFLDLCDQMGFLVMDELYDMWSVRKYQDKDYSLYFKDWWQRDSTDIISRDRNHPSIIIWCAGNEIHEITARNDLGFRTFTPLRDLIHEVDPTRPVTLAVLQPTQNGVYAQHFAEVMDIVGQNYHEDELSAIHKQRPYYKILGTENSSLLPAWILLRDDPALAGQFLWTGIDYLGEGAAWPNIGAGAGFLDRIGRPKTNAFERECWWSNTPVIHIVRERTEADNFQDDAAASIAPLPATRAAGEPEGPQTAMGGRGKQGPLADWTPRDTKPHQETVLVYSNCDSVELLLNGKSLGSQPRVRAGVDKDSPRTWKVDYVPGTLSAQGTNSGVKLIYDDELKTAGAPAKIVLTTDAKDVGRDFDSLAFVHAAVTDANGTVVPTAKDMIAFKIDGPGVIAAVDNASSASHESFQASQRSAFNGTCVAMIRASGPSGNITITASAPNLADGSLTISAGAP